MCPSCSTLSFCQIDAPVHLFIYSSWQGQQKTTLDITATSHVVLFPPKLTTPQWLWKLPHAHPSRLADRHPIPPHCTPPPLGRTSDPYKQCSAKPNDHLHIGPAQLLIRVREQVHLTDATHSRSAVSSRGLHARYRSRAWRFSHRMTGVYSMPILPRMLATSCLQNHASQPGCG